MIKIRYFFTADLHFGHANIIKYVNRPFKDVHEMNRRLVENWNSRVKPDDIVIHNGDFSFRNSKGGKPGEGMQFKSDYWRKQLNGNIIFVQGNHDRNNSTKTIIQSLVIKYGHHYINIVHNPAHWDSRFEINFVAHVHNRWKFQRVFNAENSTWSILINIGVDQWDFKPVTFEEIYSEYRKWLKSLKKEEKDESKHPKRLS